MNKHSLTCFDTSNTNLFSRSDRLARLDISIRLDIEPIDISCFRTKTTLILFYKNLLYKNLRLKFSDFTTQD